jgi:hypothetical protein
VRSFRLPIRILGVLLGAFAVFSAIANIFGFVPNSVEPWPPLLSRFLSSLPSLAGGFVLLIPMRHFSSGIVYRLLAVAYVMLCLAATALAISGVIGYAQGIKHWAVLPVGLVILAIVAANGLLLRHARHQANVGT